MAKGENKGNRTAGAVAENIGLLNVEILEECSDIVRPLLQPEGPVNVGRVSVSLALEGDHLPCPRKSWQHNAEILQCGHATVQQHQWLSTAIHFVVHVQVVYRGVVGDVRFQP